MVLPLYLAMSAVEFRTIPRPAFLVLDDSRMPPPGALPVVTDAFRVDRQFLLRLCQGREGVLLDFEYPPSADTRKLIHDLPCPAAAPPGYAENDPVFLPPPPLHVPLEKYLSPWAGREIWLEAALQKQVVTVTAEGAQISPVSSSGELSGGYYSETLCCRFTQKFTEDRAVFTLFDTPETLKRKLARAAGLGVTRAVGLYLELGEKHLSSP